MDRYEEGDQIGNGGMCTVVRTRDTLLKRQTAHKVLKPRYVQNKRHIETFVTEARLTGQLEHPNIVPIHDYGHTNDGLPFINMKLVEGDTLAKLVTDAGPDRLDPDQLAQFIQILLKVCDALAFAHSRGVVHRDLKPANIMVGPFGEVYLMDWGVAAPLKGCSIEVEIPTEHDISGTPAYMASEQVMGEDITPRTDVFALGATLYYVLTGSPPYRANGAIQALSRALEADWTPLEEVIPPHLIPPGINSILTKALQKNPADRYPSAQAIKADLENWLRGRWHLPHRTYRAGEAIILEGEEGHEAFLIVSGTCEAVSTVNGQKITLRTMGPNDVFGEMAIFSQRCRSCSIYALTDMNVQIVTRKALITATGLHSHIGKFITAMAERFLETEERLHQTGTPAK